MRTALKTDIGRIRQVNEDRSLVQTDLNGFLLAIVADGMGGHQAGDTASQMAVDIIEQEMHKVHSGMPVDECMQLSGALWKKPMRESTASRRRGKAIMEWELR